MVLMYLSIDFLLVNEGGVEVSAHLSRLVRCDRRAISSTAFVFQPIVVHTVVVSGDTHCIKRV